MQAMTMGEQSHEAWGGPFFETADTVQSFDMSELLLHAYDLGDMINQSVEVADYLYWKKAVDEDQEVQQLAKRFAKAKEAFGETERFGRFHPDYHAAKDMVKAIQRELDALEPVSRFKEAERTLDELLHEMAKQLAGSVSDTIKVPGNESAGSGCGSGGSCSCGSGGCG